MNFLNPGFLFALTAVSIPVIIHLFNFRKYKRVYFTNVAFLTAIQQQNTSRERLKNLLIMFSRILVLLFLVLAFARPYFTRSDNVNTANGDIVSIYIDNSYSMAAVNAEGTLLDEAKRKAREIVKSYGVNDKFQLLTNNFEGKHQRLVNAEVFLNELDEIRISSATKNIKQVVDRQKALFKDNFGKNAYVISDFQEGFTTNLSDFNTEDIKLSLVKLQANSEPNLAIDSVWFLSETHQPNTTEKLVVKVRNYGDKDALNTTLNLYVNDQQKGLGNLSVKAGGAATDTIAFSGLTAGWQKAYLTIKDFPITFDNTFNFTFNVLAQQQILSINSKSSNGAVKAVFSADSYFNLVTADEQQLSYNTFGNYGLIILNEITNLSSGLAQSLNAYLATGGTLLIIPNTTLDIAAHNTFLSLLKLPKFSQLNTSKTQVNQIELKSKLFEGVFETLPKNLVLPQVNNHFESENVGRFNKENLMVMPLNNSFLAKFSLSGGQVFMLYSGLKDADGDFAQHPLFLPVLYKIALASGADLPLSYTISGNNAIVLPQNTSHTNLPLKIKQKGFEITAQPNVRNGKIFLHLADQVSAPGFYTISQNDATLASVAFNSDKAESAMKFDNITTLKDRFSKYKNVHLVDAKIDSSSTIVAVKNNGIELWKLCLILSLVFIAIEILLVRYFNPTKKYISS